MKHRQERAVLVTGGRGFVGRAVGKLLRREGYEVISLDRVALTEEAGSDRINQAQCDIADVPALYSVFQNQPVEAIVHLAAILPTTAQRDPVRATAVNVQGSLNVLEMAREFGTRRVVFGSSLSVYGTYRADRAVSELDRIGPEDLYGAAKAYVEQLGSAYRSSYGLEFLSLRIGRVLGAGANSKTSAWRSEIFELIDTKSACEIFLPYMESERVLVVHVEDVARMLVALLTAEKPAHCIYNSVCESLLAGELKRGIEELNANVRVTLSNAEVVGNPRQLDSSRFTEEFGCRNVSVLEQLAKAAGGDAR
ncbi:MAG TPA: NAD(P)-dependent oxidoreductase [Candidatus Sulfotelmatobacter sp.]|jgi:UDP-glucose 4-epimerase|nr:NAD(P)-dependent oxidoreductase [Candidatus Sulfotelmatobacter sp.]